MVKATGLFLVLYFNQTLRNPVSILIIIYLYGYLKSIIYWPLLYFVWCHGSIMPGTRNRKLFISLVLLVSPRYKMAYNPVRTAENKFLSTSLSRAYPIFVKLTYASFLSLMFGRYLFHGYILSQHTVDVRCSV